LQKGLAHLIILDQTAKDFSRLLHIGAEPAAANHGIFRGKNSGQDHIEENDQDSALDYAKRTAQDFVEPAGNGQLHYPGQPLARYHGDYIGESEENRVGRPENCMGIIRYPSQKRKEFVMILTGNDVTNEQGNQYRDLPQKAHPKTAQGEEEQQSNDDKIISCQLKGTIHWQSLLKIK